MGEWRKVFKYYNDIFGQPVKAGCFYPAFLSISLDKADPLRSMCAGDESLRAYFAP
jgi:hypothetical protein